MMVNRPSAYLKSGVIRCLAELLLFALLAVAATRPVLSRSTTHLPTGVEGCATVPLLNLWTLWWNVDRLDHGYRDYWNAPIYYPAEGTLAFSEPLTASGWLAWPLWRVGVSPPRVYCTLLLVHLTLNGWVTCQLLKRWRLTWTASLAGGAMMCLLPLVHRHLGAFQLTGLWGVIWTLMALEAFRRRPAAGSAVHLAVAYAAAYLLCCYYGFLFGVVMLFCFPLLMGKRLLSRRFWQWAGVSLLLAAVLLAPVVSAQVWSARERLVEYPLELIRQLSVVPADYWETPSRQLLPLPELPGRPRWSGWELSPGTLKYVLAVVGIVIGVRSRRRRAPVLLLVSMAVVAMLLAMGPRWNWHGHSPYFLLAEYLPGYARVRNIFRFAFFVQMAIVLLAAVGLHGLQLAARRWRRMGDRPWIAVVAALAVGALMAGEAWPPAPGMYELPAASRQNGWIKWLQDDAQAEARLVFLPLPTGTTAREKERTGEWMYFQIRHQRPMANGYSAFVPIEFQQLEVALADFPSATALDALRSAGVTHCVIDLQPGTAVVSDAPSLRSAGLTLVVDDDEATLQIWQVPATSPASAVRNTLSSAPARGAADSDALLDPDLR